MINDSLSQYFKSDSQRDKGEIENLFPKRKSEILAEQAQTLGGG